MVLVLPAPGVNVHSGVWDQGHSLFNWHTCVNMLTRNKTRGKHGQLRHLPMRKRKAIQTMEAKDELSLSFIFLMNEQTKLILLFPIFVFPPFSPTEWYYTLIQVSNGVLAPDNQLFLLPASGNTRCLANPPLLIYGKELHCWLAIMSKINDLPRDLFVLSTTYTKAALCLQKTNSVLRENMTQLPDWKFSPEYYR